MEPAVAVSISTRFAYVALYVAALALPAAADKNDVASVTFVAPVTSADDAWTTRPKVQRRGAINEFDGQILELTPADGKKLRVGSHFVTELSFQWSTTAAAAADKLVDERKYVEAVKAIEAAYPALPKWQQRLLLARMVHSLSAAGKDRIAGIIFINLAAANPPPIVYADMPLCWTTKQTDSSHAGEARKWIVAEDEVSQLLGASWLLSGSMRTESERILRKLKSSKNQTIAALATAQSWRLASPPESKERATQWMKFRDNLILPLQIGPTEFLADRLTRIGETELAMGQWLRIATVHSDQHARAVVALSSAKQQLIQAERTREAESIEVWKRNLQ
ncbi:MAG: hypothetical protein Aurels2KO_27380 [Aureliella sp.]